MPKFNLKQNSILLKIIVGVLAVALIVVVYLYNIQSQKMTKEIRAYNDKMTAERFQEKERLDQIYANITSAIDNNLPGIICYHNNTTEDITVGLSLKEQIQKNIIDSLDFAKIVKKNVSSLLTLQDYSISIPVLNRFDLQENNGSYLAVVFIEESMGVDNVQDKITESIDENQDYLVVNFVTDNPTDKLKKKYKDKYIDVSGKTSEEAGTQIYQRIQQLGYFDDLLEIIDSL